MAHDAWMAELETALDEGGERVADRLDADLESRSDPSHLVVEDRTETYCDRVAAFLAEIGSQQQ